LIRIHKQPKRSKFQIGIRYCEKPAKQRKCLDQSCQLAYTTDTVKTIVEYKNEGMINFLPLRPKVDPRVHEKQEAEVSKMKSLGAV